MLASLLYSIVWLLVDLLSIRDREQAELQAEVLALRHQLRVVGRQKSITITAIRSSCARVQLVTAVG